MDVFVTAATYINYRNNNKHAINSDRYSFMCYPFNYDVVYTCTTITYSKGRSSAIGRLRWPSFGIRDYVPIDLVFGRRNEDTRVAELIYQSDIEIIKKYSIIVSL
ncbi:hypothetical protein PPL_11685 [Heterostelium album PN500]|uniref:Uncharacterized protein n=1 Tax=Heterostelium pallidum (strain ATCC 26659 / Pp 5 / PN500) TaxID=670386 RepID=D3BU66_HETP5|nr:hypothetical protein PPL_11685 [Heterostelium album PN500]EFA75000.1 hypothetical protein PPL_11685 [Heterostelium album PN500]|eukprot:XP_020427134.1 hypothetical protein PPL_11685 [Heterostelium album PN500]